MNTKLYKKILKKITPSKKELLGEKKTFEEINEKIMKIGGSHARVEWCGSSARGTHLHNDRDLDLFVMFDKETSESELEKQGLKIGKNVFRGQKWEKAYSQHPYIRGNYKGFDVEIVPSYIIEKGNEKKSAVDRTPFHNKYIKSKMSEQQKMYVRLMKQFMKGINAYGADLKNCALPGYAMELIILHYKDFDNSIEEISNWKIGQTILFENAKEENTKQFKGAPLIIIDPVDENRNVASALSFEQFERMIYAAQSFIKNPKEKFFFPEIKKAWDKKKVKQELTKKELLAIKADFPKKILPDLMWGQLRRYLKKINTHLKEKDFKVTKNTLWSNEEKVFFIFELENLTLQKAKKITGPLASDKENSEKFLEKKRKILSGPQIEEGRLVLEIEREDTNAKETIKKFIKTCKTDESEGMIICLRKAKVLEEKDLLKEYKGEFAQFFTKYLEGKEIFE